MIKIEEPITEKDAMTVVRVHDFLSKHNIKSEVRCDKGCFGRVKDFAIDLTTNYWFETEYVNLRTRMSKSTVNQLNYILYLLQAYSKELGITSVSRHRFGIIFNARKGGAQ